VTEQLYQNSYSYENNVIYITCHNLLWSLL